MSSVEQRRVVEILAMDEGFPLDVEVQRVVFGTKRVYCNGGQLWTPNGDEDFQAFYIPSGKPWKTHSIDGRPVPRYSTDFGAAAGILAVWEGDWKIRRQNEMFKVTLYRPSMQGSEWAETLPLAICRMRLRAALAWKP